MDSLIEKITLYDILGYAIPGNIFLLIVSLGDRGNMETSVLLEYKDYGGFAIFVFLLLGYVLGIIISELSRIIVSLCGLLLKSSSKCVVDTELVVAALKKSKFVKPDAIITDINKEYYGIMYSDIQTDPAYKRVHNYASAETMYKNLVMSFLSGLLWHCIFFSESNYFNILLGTCLAAAILLGVRWYRFAEKTKNYTILWFVKKYIVSE